MDHAGRLYWIQDPRDELCVGEVRGVLWRGWLFFVPDPEAGYFDGSSNELPGNNNHPPRPSQAGMMMPCGDSNLWGVRGKKGGYTLELISGRQIGPDWSWHEVRQRSF